MGTHRLKITFPSKFLTWVKRSGYRDEFDFWSSLSGINSTSMVDHMVKYLSSLGYSGTPQDQFRRFLKDQVGLVGNNLEGTTFDMASEFFDLTFIASVASSASVAAGVHYTDLIPYEGFITAGIYQ